MKAPLSFKARALRLLARREHSRAELERKLAATLQPAEADEDAQTAMQSIQQALDELAARGLLNDERAAESVLASQGRRFGSHRLKQTLLAKGLAPELVTASLQALRATEYERARALWRRRFGRAPADAAERARQMRFLAGRGFDGDVISRLMRLGSDDLPEAPER